MVKVPLVVTSVIGPVGTPVGATASTRVDERAVKVALTPPKSTEVRPWNPPPSITTLVPTEPKVGVNRRTRGSTAKVLGAVATPAGVVTVERPSMALVGT